MKFRMYCYILLLRLMQLRFLVSGRNYEVAIVVDNKSNRSYDQYLSRRALDFAHEVNTSPLLNPPFPHVRMWSPSRCRLSNSSSSILTHARIWEDYCINRHSPTDEYVVLVLEGDFFCRANDCSVIFDSHIKSQITDLFIYGYCGDIPTSKDKFEINQLPACSEHAYSIKCSAVKKILSNIDSCNEVNSTLTNLNGILHDLVFKYVISWDYIGVNEFTVNETAIKDIELSNFGKVSIIPESQSNGMIWWLQVEEDRAQRKCSGYLSYNSSTNICTPTKLCGNATNLNEIPNFNGYFPSSVLCDANNTEFKRLFDTTATRKCLNKKKVCMLGDSTIEETIHDIIVLLSGLGSNVSRVVSHYIEIERHTSPINIAVNDVFVEMKAPYPSNRYTGHRNLAEAGEGITALLFALKTLNLTDCDFLVFQSAVYDYARMEKEGCFVSQYANPNYLDPDCKESYLRHIREIADLISLKFSGNNSKTKIFWKSEPFLAIKDKIFIPTEIKLSLEDSISKIFAATPIKFVNISKTLAHLPHTHANWLMHIGQKSRLNKSLINLLWTFVSTETLLNHLCPS